MKDLAKRIFRDRAFFRAFYFALHDSLRVRRVALDDIPGSTGKNSEECSWNTQPT